MSIAKMTNGYGQFCPVAKASEIFATRWTPLVVRELLFGSHTFNDIHRGVPLMSRALLIERLRQLEERGIVEKEAALTHWAMNTGLRQPANPPVTSCAPLAIGVWLTPGTASLPMISIRRL